MTCEMSNIRKQLDDFRSIVKAPFIYGEDFLPSEEMSKFLMELGDISGKYLRSKDEEVKDLANRLEDFLQVGGPSGRNLGLKDRLKRISGKKSKLDEFHQERDR